MFRPLTFLYTRLAPARRTRFAAAIGVCLALMAVPVTSVGANHSVPRLTAGAAAIEDCDTAAVLVNRTVKRVATRKVELKYATSKARAKRARSSLRKARATAAQVRRAVRVYCRPTATTAEWRSGCLRAITRYETAIVRSVRTRILVSRTKSGKLKRHRRKALKSLRRRQAALLAQLDSACGQQTNGGSGGSGGNGGGSANVPFTDPTSTTSSGTLGVICLLQDLLDFGCTANDLTITIPTNPNGLTGTYRANLSAYIHGLTGVNALTTFTMTIRVDSAGVASDSETQLLLITPVDLAAQALNVDLSASQSHVISVSLKSSTLLSVLPTAATAGLTVDLQ
jgi:hypothetical protein